MRSFHIPHEKRVYYCPTCCDVGEDGFIEETPHKIHHIDISTQGRGCFGATRGRIFEYWECQRCGSVHLV